MTSTAIYCTYVTFYSGNKLPPFYIGYSKVINVMKGYHGSILSRKWRDIYRLELKENPHLFTTEIINTFETRKEALLNELELHISNNVVKSKWFINESLAKVNGFYGSETKGIKNKFKGTRFWNNGVKDIRSINCPGPDFVLGRKPFNNVGTKIGADLNKSKHWITNGLEEKFVLKSDLLPDGYKIGRSNSICDNIKISAKSRCKRKWIHNKADQIEQMIPIKNSLPDGYQPGRLNGNSAMMAVRRI